VSYISVVLCSKTSDTCLLCSCTVYMWQRLLHDSFQWLPGTMRHEWVIVIRTGSGGSNRLCFRMQSNCGRL